MMLDQADKLRQLVRETIKENATLEPGLPLLAVSGARGAIGTSTLAARLAQKLTQLGKRVILVDANLLHPTLAGEFAVDTHFGIAEVLNGTRSAAEVLEPVGPGLYLMSAAPSQGTSSDLSMTALRRLITELRTLQSVADMVILDAGHGMCPWTERLWIAAQQILLVTTAEATVVRDAYTTVKLAPWGDVDGKLRLVVNKCDEMSLATRVGDGFSSTCRQFLVMKLVGAAAQVTHFNYAGFRQSLRLLAADTLSYSCAYSRRLPRSAGAGAGMPAGALVTRTSF
jgi:MinD-like ATPase involved in chromosome partitioning or flagellar assembly